MAATKKKVTRKGKPRGNPNPKNQFQKGNTISKLGGRPTLTPEQKALRLTTRTQFKTLLAEYSALTLDEIRELIKEAKLPIIDMAVLKHLQESFTNGSMERIDWTTNHIMGKPKETTNLHLSGGVQSSDAIDVKKLSKEDLLALKEIHERSKEKTK
jgi:hypothetical protein